GGPFEALVQRDSGAGRRGGCGHVVLQGEFPEVAGEGVDGGGAGEGVGLLLPPPGAQLRRGGGTVQIAQHADAGEPHPQAAQGGEEPCPPHLVPPVGAVAGEGVDPPRHQQLRVVVEAQRLGAQAARGGQLPDAQQRLVHAILRHASPGGPGTGSVPVRTTLGTAPGAESSRLEDIPSTSGDRVWSTASMHVTIRPLDPSSDAELDQYLSLEKALDEHSYGGSQALTREQLRSQVSSSPYWEVRHWVALAEIMEGGSSLVGRAAVFLPLQENLETVSVGVAVHPAVRGRGIATALIEEVLLPAIRESGRSLVEAYAEIPPDGDPDDPSQPALRLAQRLGVSRRNLAVCRALPLPLEDSLLEELEAEAAE